MGRVVSHPHAIQVSSDDGNVTLRGLILQHEQDPFLSILAKVKGVKSVRNELHVHKREENIPSLQGGTPRVGPKLDVFHANWAPATRLMMALGGIGLCTFGAYRRTIFGAALIPTGFLVLARSIWNLEVRRLLGVGAKRRAVTLHKTIHIHAPANEVYRFWSNFENFPKFMSEVKEVRTGQDRKRSHWTVQGPLGAPVSWDTEITRDVPDQVLAWKSTPGALIQNAGQVKFASEENGGTRIDLDFTYNPPAGALGHALAKLFGSAPKKRIEASLAEMKQLIERGPSHRQTKAL